MQTKDTINNLIDVALAIADEGYPVFPTINKRPCWSNSALGVKRGDGGHKIASVDEAEIRKLFSHKDAVEISVPMGEPSGIICIDVDTNKDSNLQHWMDTQPWLRGTRTHGTRSGGRHFFFRYNKDRHLTLPRQLRNNVDIKGNGGFVCWIGTPGYTVVDASPPATLPPDVLSRFTATSSSTTRPEAWYNDATDAELVADIKSAMSLYPALLTLSWRYAQFRRKDDGSRYAPDEVKAALKGIMDASAAADPQSNRHADWKDRYPYIDSMVDNAYAKASALSVDDKTAEALQKLVTDDSPVSRIHATFTGANDSFTDEEAQTFIADDDRILSVNPHSLHNRLIPPIDWIIPNMLPAYNLVSLAGASNVGKTRWLALLASACITGDSEAAGLPAMENPVSVLWVANEERKDDIARRIKAACRYYEWHDDTHHRVHILGKDEGQTRLLRLTKGELKKDEVAIQFLADTIRKRNVKVLIFDPYVTLGAGVTENAAEDASMINEVFLDLIAATGVAIIHAHHAPKDNSKEADWYRGSAAAWRGSSAIYSSLDCGFTLAPVVFTGDKRTKRKGASAVNYVVLESAKIREGERITPVYYELIGHPMASGEGHNIAVCRLSSRVEAEDAVNDEAKGNIAGKVLADALIDALEEGDHTNFSVIHNAMKHNEFWVSHASTGFPASAKQTLYKLMGNSQIPGEKGSVQYIRREPPQRDAIRIIKKI